MSYIGSTPTTQSFIAGTDYFNGNGSTVNFTLSRSVNSVNDIEVIVNNVEQIPSGYSVSGTTLTFSAAPSAGTSNVYVRYLSTTNLSLAIPAGTSATFNTVTVADGSATTPSITNDGDTNTGIFFPAADTVGVATGGSERLRVDSSGFVGIGTTTPTRALTVVGTWTNTGDYLMDSGSPQLAWTSGDLRFKTGGLSGTEVVRIDSSGTVGIGTSSPYKRLNATKASSTAYSASDFDIDSLALQLANTTNDKSTGIYFAIGSNGEAAISAVETSDGETALTFGTRGSGSRPERARITSGGYFCVGTTTQSTSSSTNGFVVGQSGETQIYRDSAQPLVINRNTNDGALVSLRQADIEEGNISVSGTTVSYNGGHLSRWAQTTAPKDDTLVKGTVLSNLDEMNIYTDADGNPVDNEQLNKVKVSDVEGDANVAGVFVNWTHDEAHDVDEINMAMTGDMIIRIAQGTTVARGDLLMSAGDGTAKPQGDDIVRSKTVAKVTSTHVTCTYADGSYCVPCVLMAC
jgi:hypothetical protein